MSRHRNWKAKKYGPKPVPTVSPKIGDILWVDVNGFSRLKPGVTHTFPTTSVNQVSKSGFSYADLATGKHDDMIKSMMEKFGTLAQTQPLSADQVKTILGLESDGNPSASPTN